MSEMSRSENIPCCPRVAMHLIESSHDPLSSGYAYDSVPLGQAMMEHDRSNSGGLATLCLLLCTLVHSGDSGHSITSYCLLPAPGWPLPPLGHGLVILQRHPQLLQLTSLYAPPLSTEAEHN